MKRLIQFLPVILIPAILLAVILFLGSSFFAEPHQAASVTSNYVANGRDGSFTIAWTTDTASDGYIEYSTTTSLDQTAEDVRGSGYSGETHYVDITGLSPSTLYYYDIISGGERDDNGGAHYTFTTGPTLSIPVQGNCSYGQVFLSDGTTPAAGAIVIITLNDINGGGSSGDSAPMSALVDDGGYWYACFNNSRVTTLDNYFTFDRPGDNVTLEADGASSGVATQTIDTDTSAPAPDMILGAEVCVDVGVVTGWNMTSVPVLAEDMTLGALFPDAVPPGYYFTSSYQSVNTPDTLTNGEGYWMYFNEAHTYQICGSVVSSKDVSVNAGWNMIGPFEEAVTVASITSTPADILTPPVYGFDTSYVEIDTLLSGEGYWVYVNQEGTLHLGGADESSPRTVYAPQTDTCNLTWTTNIEVEDNGANADTLGIGQGPSGTNDLNTICSEARLPPKPPAGAFDARLILPGAVDASRKDYRSSLDNQVEWRLEFQPGSGGDPFTFTWDPAALPDGSWRLQDPYGGSLIDVDMTAQDSYILGNADFDSLKIKYVSSTQLSTVYLPLILETGG